MSSTLSPPPSTMSLVQPPAGARRSWLSFLPSTKSLIILAVALVIGYLALVPLGYLLYGTFADENGFTLAAFGRAYGDPEVVELLLNSLVFAVGAAIVALIVGTGLAYLNVRTDVPSKGLFFASSIIPLVLPGILYAVAWVFLASPRVGVLNAVFEAVFGGTPFDIFSIGGMIWVEGLHLSPIVFLLMVAAFRSMDPTLEESALMSGASRWTAFRRVTIPLVRPAIIASLLVMVVRSLESFEVPALLGLQDGTYVFTSKIYEVLHQYPSDFGKAGALALGLLLIAIVGVIIGRMFESDGKSYQTVTGKGFRPRPIELGRWRWVASTILFLYVIVTIVLPLGILLWTSLLKYYGAPSAEMLSQLTVDNYARIFTSAQTGRAFFNSILLGLATATIVMLLMAIGAWIVVRSRIRGRTILTGLSFVPLVIPGLVLGLALSFVFLRSPIPIYGTLWILLIAYVTRFIPYGMQYATTSMHQISSELEESAAVSGASWWQTFRRVLLPLLWPGLMAGWVYILIVSFRELSSSILLYSPGSEVLSIVIFEMFENGLFTQLAALSIVMVVALVALVTLAKRLGANVGLQDD